MKRKLVALAAVSLLTTGSLFAYAQQPPEAEAEQTELSAGVQDEEVSGTEVKSEEADPDTTPASTQESAGDEENGDGCQTERPAPKDDVDE